MDYEKYRSEKGSYFGKKLKQLRNEIVKEKEMPTVAEYLIDPTPTVPEYQEDIPELIIDDTYSQYDLAYVVDRQKIIQVKLLGLTPEFYIVQPLRSITYAKLIQQNLPDRETRDSSNEDAGVTSENFSEPRHVKKTRLFKTLDDAVRYIEASNKAAVDVEPQEQEARTQDDTTIS